MAAVTREVRDLGLVQPLDQKNLAVVRKFTSFFSADPKSNPYSEAAEAYQDFAQKVVHYKSLKKIAWSDGKLAALCWLIVAEAVSLFAFRLLPKLFAIKSLLPQLFALGSILSTMLAWKKAFRELKKVWNRPTPEIVRGRLAWAATESEPIAEESKTNMGLLIQEMEKVKQAITVQDSNSGLQEGPELRAFVYFSDKGQDFRRATNALRTLERCVYPVGLVS